MSNQIHRLLLLLVIGCLIWVSNAPARTDDDQVTLSQPLTILWKYQTNDIADLTPASDGKEIFLPLSGGVIIALSGADGKLHWRAEVGGDFSAAPVADDRALYIAGLYPDADKKHVHGTLRAVSKSTGVTLWISFLPTPITGALAVGGTSLFGTSADGYVYAFNRLSGLVLWRNEYTDDFSGDPTLDSNRLYVGGKSGIVRAFDVNTGQLAWQYKTRGAVHGPIAVKDRVAYFGSDDGNVYAFNETRSKALWHRRAGAAVRAVIALDDGVLASSLDNFAYLLSLNKGALIWRRQLPGRVSSRPLAAPDGVLFTPFSTDAAIVLNLRDGKPANTLSLGEQNSTAAAPIVVGKTVVITTPHGLIAFSGPVQK